MQSFFIDFYFFIIIFFFKRQILLQAKGVKLVDEPLNSIYPMPINASECDDVEVGRIRQSLVYKEKGLDLFVSGDQLLRGAALNAVLIAEKILEN
jgi:aspartate-semialdehyde dehydrogenase